MSSSNVHFGTKNLLSTCSMASAAWSKPVFFLCCSRYAISAACPDVTSVSVTPSQRSAYQSQEFNDHTGNVCLQALHLIIARGISITRHEQTELLSYASILHFKRQAPAAQLSTGCSRARRAVVRTVCTAEISAPGLDGLELQVGKSHWYVLWLSFNQ